MIAAVFEPGDALLGESPVWLGSAEGLWWVDLLRADVLREDPSGGPACRVAGFPGTTASALIPLSDGRITVTLRSDLVAIDDVGMETARAEGLVPAGLRFSDGCAGPTGHLWLGVVRDEGFTGAGYLLRVGADGVRIMREGVGFANGIGFDAECTTLFHVDSDAGTLSAIEHDPATGMLGSSRVMFSLPLDEGSLDGLAVDEHDRVWVAVFGGGVVLCVDSHGRVVQEVEVAAPRVTSCAFGDGDTLYITTARVDADQRELASAPDAGSVFSCSVGTAGAPIWKGLPWI